jgi:hypothetical protein
LVYRLFVTRLGEFDWCFSSLWSDIDPSAKAAAARLLWLNAHGLPDDQWEQGRGDAPLSCRSDGTRDGDLLLKGLV